MNRVAQILRRELTEQEERQFFEEILASEEAYLASLADEQDLIDLYVLGELPDDLRKGVEALPDFEERARWAAQLLARANRRSPWQLTLVFGVVAAVALLMWLTIGPGPRPFITGFVSVILVAGVGTIVFRRWASQRDLLIRLAETSLSRAEDEYPEGQQYQ